MRIRRRSSRAATLARAGRSPQRSPLSSFFCAALLLSTLSVGASAADDARAQAFCTRLDAAIATLSDRSGAEAYRGCQKFVAELIDLDAVAVVGAGRAWETMAGAQRAAYRDALATRLPRDCGQGNKDNAGRPTTFVGTRRGEGGELLVATRAEKRDGESHTIVWRLPTAPQPRDRAVDLQIDGRSVSLTLREEANRAVDAAEAATRSLQR